MRGQRLSSQEHIVELLKTMFWRCLNQCGKTNTNDARTSKHSEYSYDKKCQTFQWKCQWWVPLFKYYDLNLVALSFERKSLCFIQPSSPTLIISEVICGTIASLGRFRKILLRTIKQRLICTYTADLCKVWNLQLLWFPRNIVRK